MPNGETHFRYYRAGWKFIFPESILLALWDWKFALGNIVGYFVGRWVDP